MKKSTSIAENVSDQGGSRKDEVLKKTEAHPKQPTKEPVRSAHETDEEREAAVAEIRAQLNTIPMPSAEQVAEITPETVFRPLSSLDEIGNIGGRTPAALGKPFTFLSVMSMFGGAAGVLAGWATVGTGAILHIGTFSFFTPAAIYGASIIAGAAGFALVGVAILGAGYILNKLGKNK